MTTMPTDVVYGKVVGRFLLAVADATDPDRLPDAQAATGQIIFTPTVPNMKTAAPDLATVIKVPIRCTIDPEGYLVDPEGGRGVWLVAGNYRVTYALAGATIDPQVISVLTDHTDVAPLDLTNSLPPSGPGISPSQYTMIMARIDTLDYPVDSVNGKTGTVILTAGDVDAYTKVETDDKFATQQALSDAKFQQVDVQLEAIDYPVDSVNGMHGDVVLTASDVDAYSKTEADSRYKPVDAVGLPVGGAKNQTLIKQSSNPGDAGWRYIPRFRGAYSSLSLIKTFDLSSMPPEFSNPDGYTLIPNPGGTGAPSGSNVLSRPTDNTTHDITFVVPAGVTRVQVKKRTIADAGAGATAYCYTALAVNGNVIPATKTYPGSGIWEQVGISVLPGDVVALRTFDYVNWRTTGQFGQIELYGALDPYMIGDNVVHNGLIYTSGIDNNASVPGTDANWSVLTSPSYTKTESDAKYIFKTDAYTKTESDAKYASVNANLLPNGGTKFQSLVKQSSNNGDVIWKYLSRFRGAFSTMAIVKTFDLATMPVEFNNTGNYILSPNPGGANAPSGAQVLDSGTINNATRDISFLVPAGVSQVRVHKIHANAFGQGQLNQMSSGIAVNGDTSGSLTNALGVWEVLSRNVVEGQTVAFRTFDAGGWSTRAKFGQIELLGTAEPYMVGDSVVYNGLIYTSTIDTNGSVPGTDANWTVLTSPSYTKTEADAKYALKTDSYTKAEADARFAAETEMAWKTVVTPATDVRPNALHVIWVGGTVRPTNMTTEDLWVQATA